MKLSSNDFRRWCRLLHRDLSFIFAGMVFIYALSGIFMNHRDTINPRYTITRTEHTLSDLPTKEAMTRECVEEIMVRLDIEESYTKHYFPKENCLKVFLKGGSSLEVDITSGCAVYESLKRRPLIGQMTKLHYNPGRWWTWFSDIFAVALMVITLTGLFMLKGNKGLWGRGGIELLIGIAIPILFVLLS